MTKKLLKHKKTEAERIHRIYDTVTKREPKLLDQREKEIVEKYYGFNGNFRHTLQEIAGEHGITRERIRQIKHYAITKLESSGR